MNRKIEALQEAAASKAKESAQRVELALDKMLKQGQLINFKSVAHVANVSTAYLYKQTELRNRIETLRDEQKNRSKPKQPPPASDNSKAVIIYNLRAENKKIRTEIDELRKINESLTGRLYQLQDASNLAERFKTENAELKQQLEECRRYQIKPPASPPDHPKVTSLEKKRTGRSGISDNIKQQLIDSGIQLNSTLTKTIKSASESTVLNAIAAFKEAMATDNIEKPGAWLKSAIEDGWLPNEPLASETAIGVKNEFAQWFELASSMGIARARQETQEGFMIQDSTGQWLAWESFVESGWTLEYLKKRARTK